MAAAWSGGINLPCRYYANGHCRAGNECRFSHERQVTMESTRTIDGIMEMDNATWPGLNIDNVVQTEEWNTEVDNACEACNLNANNPQNPPLSPGNASATERQTEVDAAIRNNERRLEAEAGRLRSIDKSCGVCLEVILEKQPGEQRFGILPNCGHCFCLSCLRQWRQARQFTANIIRACPHCRIPSDFVCPSVFWVETQEQKDKLISDYKAALGAKDCKYFKSGRGKCPFGNKCFYRHAFPDGTKADVGPPRPRPNPRPRNHPDLDILEVSLTISHWHILALLPTPPPPPPPPVPPAQAF